MQVDYIIVGQGICGSLLSWFLHQEGKSFVILDDGNTNTASHIAAGIINPVTGRRYAYTWMIDEVMPFAVDTYQNLGHAFETSFVSAKSIIDFFPSPQMREAFIERLEENDTYLHSYPDQNHYNPYFNYEFGCGQVRPAYLVQMRTLLNTWKNYLQSKNWLQPTIFNEAALTLKDGSVAYEGITAEKIIFCDGIAAATSSWFELLPFAPNKGQALIIESSDLPDDNIFKKGLMLAPLPAKGTYWVGSNYEWSFENADPTDTFREHTTHLLKNWIRTDFRILHHRAGVRPATLERRPFVGFHPAQPAIGILNGMGTKGASLAPFFANQLTQHLVYGLPISPDADIHRFNRLLLRS